MRKKTIKRFAALVLALVMMFAMGISSFAATSEKDYSRVRLTRQDQRMLKTIFDAEWYKANYPDVVEAMGDSEDVLFTHFLTHGMWETRQPSADFNVNAYYVSYPDLQDATAGMTEAERVKALFLHYATTGKDADKREYTTIEKALEIVPKVTYVGSFHNEEVEKSQYGDILAQRATASAALADPVFVGFLNQFYADMKAFFTNPDNGFTSVISTPIEYRSGRTFPGFDAYEECTTNFEKYQWWYDFVGFEFFLTSRTGEDYANYKSLCDDSAVVTQADANARGDRLQDVEDSFTSGVFSFLTSSGVNVESSLEVAFTTSCFSDLREYYALAFGAEPLTEEELANRYFGITTMVGILLGG